MADALSADRAATRLATRLSFFVAGFAMACWVPLVPYAKARLGADDGAFGLFLLCMGIGSIIGMPLTGALVARLGSRPAALAGDAGLCLVLPALAVASTGPALALSLILFGAALGMIDVAINVHAIEAEKAAGRSLMSGFHGLFSLGGLAGAGAVTGLLAVGLTPLVAALAGSLVAAAALAAAAPGLLRSRPDRSDPMFTMPRGVVRLVGALAFAAFLVEGALLDWSALFVTGSLGFAVAQGGIGYALFSVAMTAGRLTGDQVVKRLGGVRVLLWGGVLVAAGFALLLLAPAGWAALGGFVAVGLGAANLVPALFSAAGRQRAMPEALAVASITTMEYAGILLGPALIGFVADASSLRAAFAMLGALMLLFPLLRNRVPTAENA